MANKLDMLSKSLQENLDLTAYSQVGHTHNYAGSSTAGGAANSATKLATARTINGTSFDGTGNITTANWGTTRSITIGSKAKDVNGSANVSWTLDEIGAAAKSHTHNYITSRGNVTAETTTNRPAVSGLSMSHAYNNGYPTNYGNVMTMKGSGDGQLLIGWSGTSGAHAPVYVRSKRDTTDANWSEWAQIYTTANKPTYSDVGAAAASHGTHVTYASATPKENGTAAVGSSSKVAREDHVHPLQTTISGNAGSADKLSTGRTITIGNKSNTFDGTANITYTLADIGASATSHTHNYAGSSSAGGAANSVKTNLIIKLNGGSTEGTNLFTFNGSAAKTINITPSSIGAAGSSHGTHVSYSTSAPLVAGTASAGSASNVSRGDHVHPAQTSVSGNAGTATKLATARNITIGNKTNSFDGSANISYSLADIGALPLTGGTISGGSGLTVTTAADKTKAFVVQRNGAAESTKMYQDDTSFYIDMTNDETAASIKFLMSATDTENGDGTGGFTNSTVTFTGSSSGSTVTAGTFTGALNGNAKTATKAGQWTNARTLQIGSSTKTYDGTANVSYSLTEIGAAASSHTHNYAGSASAGGAANSVKTNLVVKLNSGTTEGTNMFTFNGSTAKTVNITPSAIGAAASSHGTHVTYSTTTPKVAGTAAVGSEGAVARGDHVHPPQTSVTGNAGTATKLATARTIQIGNKSNTFDGSGNITYTLADIGAAPISHGQHAVYGTCETAAGTAEKAITISGSGFSLAAGQVISVKFTASNTASNVKFNVNSTGAKPIWYNNAEYTGNSNRVVGYANAVMTYVYNGTHWVWISSGVDNNTTYSNVALGHGYATCDTAEATVAKVGTLGSYSLQKGGIVAVKFSYAVPASATLNINSKGAKAIYFRNAAITANIIKAGDTATFIYDGSYYQLLSIDRWQNDLTSHTHNYAGSSSAGGAANTAVKWHTARTLTIGNTGKSVDGSGNQSWSISEIGAIPLTGNTGAYSITGNLEFSNTDSAFRGVVGKVGTNDYWRVGGGATASNAGYMEIATCDDSNEPIYVRQYSGSFSTLTRTLTLLDASGNTSMPGNLAVSKGVNAQDVTASGNVTVTGTVKIGSVTMKYNDTSESLDFIFA